MDVHKARESRDAHRFALMPWLYFNAHRGKNVEEKPIVDFLIPAAEQRKSKADTQKEIDTQAALTIARFKQLLANMKANPQRYADNG